METTKQHYGVIMSNKEAMAGNLSRMNLGCSQVE